VFAGIHELRVNDMILPSLPDRFGRPLQLLTVAAVIAIGLGAIVPAYAEALGDSYAKLMALPAIILLTMLVTLSRTMLLLIIVFLRAATESLFDASRFSVGGSAIGLGGLLNLFAIIIATLLVFERPQFFSKSILKIWGAFLLMVFFGVFNSPDEPAAWRFLLQWTSNFSIFVAAYYFVRSESDFKRIIKLVLWSSAVPALVGIFQAATGTGYVTLDAGTRVVSTFNHPNIFAFYLTIIIAMSLFVMKSPLFALSSSKRWMLGLYLLVLIGLLVMTKTRSAWFATFAVFAIYGAFFERRYLIYILVAGVVALFIPEVGERLGDLGGGAKQQVTSYDQLNSFSWRVGLWKSGLGWMTTSHYLAGYGVDAFKWYAPIFFDDFTHAHWGAHSVYVQMIFDFGILGLMSFLWMYGQVLNQIRKMFAWDRLSAFFLGMLVMEFLVVAYSDNMLDYQSFNWYLWFVVGAGIAMRELKSSPVPPASAASGRPAASQGGVMRAGR